MNLEEYGRSVGDRIVYLKKNLSEDENRKYFRLDSFINIWSASTGGSGDINEHTEFFLKTNMYALRQIDSVFFEKFGCHIQPHAHQLEMTDEEWMQGIKPTTVL